MSAGASLLRCLTITGADDGVAPAALADLSDEFPFVEWGILFSPKRQGTPRYPSEKWLSTLEELTRDRFPRLSGHLCGQAARDVFEDRAYEWFDRWQPSFDRVQLNGFAEYASAPATQGNLIRQARHRRSIEFILQAGSPEVLAAAERIAWSHQRGYRPSVLAEPSGNIVALYDPSGGRGERVFEWPAPPLWIRVGYAGGIGLDTVRSTLEELACRGQPFWVDLESGARTEDRFHLGFVRRFLETTAEWLRKADVR